MPASRPVILLGHGIRAAGAADLAPRLLELGVPVLASWQAKDLVDNAHELFMGCPGIYGNRAANLALHHASEILAIGNRLSIWNVGYEGIRQDQALTAVTLDEEEGARYPHATWIRRDCLKFLSEPPLPAAHVAQNLKPEIEAWALQCKAWKKALPAIESPAHDDPEGAINSYRLFDALGALLAPDAQVAIDCGAACASAFQVLKVKPPQRLYSSGGLGEMGCALPAAIGVSFARAKGQVICITGDGALMLNLQELQTIVHHNLPVKILVARNDGYLMIRHTQRNAKMPFAGSHAASGVSCPRFQQLAFALGMHAASVRTWEDFHHAVPAWLAHDGPALIEYHMDPNQVIGPKLGYKVEDGKQRYAPFDQMSPALESA